MTDLPLMMAKAGLPKQGRLTDPRRGDRERRELGTTSPLRNGTAQAFRATPVDAVPFDTQPHLALVVRERQVQLSNGSTVTKRWEYVIRVACQHMVEPGADDCRFGCENPDIERP